MGKKKQSLTLDPRLLQDALNVIADLDRLGMDASANIVRDLLAEAERRQGLYQQIQSRCSDQHAEIVRLQHRIEDLLATPTTPGTTGTPTTPEPAESGEPGKEGVQCG